MRPRDGRRRRAAELLVHGVPRAEGDRRQPQAASPPQSPTLERRAPAAVGRVVDHGPAEFRLPQEHAHGRPGRRAGADAGAAAKAVGREARGDLRRCGHRQERHGVSDGAGGEAGGRRRAAGPAKERGAQPGGAPRATPAQSRAAQFSNAPPHPLLSSTSTSSSRTASSSSTPTATPRSRSPSSPRGSAATPTSPRPPRPNSTPR